MRLAKYWRDAHTDSEEVNVVDKIDTNLSATALWVIAVIVAVIGIIVLISGSTLWGILLLIAAALIGPGGYTLFRRR